ncbi:VOC family protein [Flexibacterium corallicola]|uniref:VOC family protein n=1 Tax=Flexibacterium corallicola TaxID=3037259 RepID=UPI00286F3845|nr:VOC family protein [Pseudovibrio sp. M1P-2-3]
MASFLEHVNITVSDPDATANRLVDWFGWKVRWKGLARAGGTTIHVGNDESYLAVYSLGNSQDSTSDTYETKGGLNHVGVVVNDLDAVEKKVLDAGYNTRNHADYEPGKRFYFDDDDGIEFEIVSYA